MLWKKYNPNFFFKLYYVKNYYFWIFPTLFHKWFFFYLYLLKRNYVYLLQLFRTTFIRCRIVLELRNKFNALKEYKIKRNNINLGPIFPHITFLFSFETEWIHYWNIYNDLLKKGVLYLKWNDNRYYIRITKICICKY